jgi:UDP-N-acetylmuramyl pentapeptide phosphotransferase/UDP-N-acetylglucosamine-1-phosphate transferase
VTIAGLVVSALLAAWLLPAWTTDMLRSGLTRENWRGRTVAFPSGALAISVSVIALAPLAVLNDRADLDLLEPDLARWAAYLLGIAMLGLLDDMLGRGHAGDTARGWRGHARAVLSGRLSTGAIKAAGAFGLAAFAVSGLGREWPGYLADLALLLLTTNLFNLLDLRPGRSAKALLILGAALSVGAWSPDGLWTVGLFLGPVLVLLPFDLRERGMLGDTGSNAIGAVAGLWLVATLSTTGQAIALAVMAVVTVYGEFRSISALIERTPGLRQLDSLGRIQHA